MLNGSPTPPVPPLPTPTSLGTTPHPPPSDLDAQVSAALRRPRRVAALRASGILDAPPAPNLGRLAELAAELFGTPAASVSLLDADRHLAVARFGTLDGAPDAGAELALDYSICRFTVTAAAPVAIDDTRLDARTRGSAAVTELGVLAYLGAPVVVHGEPIGALCVFDCRPRQWSGAQVGSLAAVAAAVISEIELGVLTRERAMLREAERAAREAAAAASRAKSDFLAVMSHELRTPLNAIGGYVDLMEMGLRGPVSEAQHRDLARVKHAQQHLLGLVNDVLNLSKLEEGRVRYAIDAVPVRAPIESVEAIVAPQLAARGIAYAFEPCAPEVRVRADAEKVRQILLNLLSNAVKFTRRGGAITVRCADDAAGLGVWVCDTGSGIAAEKLATIFDPFVQVDRDLSRPGEGIGLGLAISRDLARAMGGELTVESAPGRGSTFTLRLPRA